MECRIYKTPCSVADRTNHSRRIASGKGIRGNVLGDYRTCRDNRILTHGYAADDGRAGCYPDVSLNHDGLSDYGCAPLGWWDRMACRVDTHVRPDHHVIANSNLGE